MARIILSILFASVFLWGFGQEVGVDTPRVAPVQPDSLRWEVFRQQNDSLGNNQSPAIGYVAGYRRLNDSREFAHADLVVPDFSFIPGQARIFSWNSGGIIVSGGRADYPGLLKVDSGALGIFQTFGDFKAYFGATVDKYGWYQGVDTRYGLSGSLNYQFSPRFSATLFGSYYFGAPPRMANVMPMPPSMLGYYGYTKFGGYVDYNINDRFGVQVGGQVVKRTYGRGYEAEPIATPYVKVGRKKKIAIGLPVGQILYHCLGK